MTGEGRTKPAGTIANTARVSLLRHSLAVTDCNEEAAELLGLQDDCKGHQWPHVLRDGHSFDASLIQVLTAGIHSRLPAFVVRDTDDEEIIVAGMVVPRNPQCIELVLWPVSLDDQTILPVMPGPADTVAVLGARHLAYGEDWQVPDTQRLMMDIRSSLLDIVRAQDQVGLPVGASIAIIFSELDAAGAQDISLAILSHLNAVLRQYHEHYADAHLAIGLAQVTPELSSPMQALIGANAAMLDDRGSAAVEAIHLSSAINRRFEAGFAIDGGGLFSHSVSGTGQRAYLKQIAGIDTVTGQPEDYLRQLVEITLQQSGVSACAAFGDSSGPPYTYVCGAVHADAAADFRTLNKMPAAMRSEVRRLRSHDFEVGESIAAKASSIVSIPLRHRRNTLGYLMLEHDGDVAAEGRAFVPDAGVSHYIAGVLLSLAESGGRGATRSTGQSPVVAPIETGIDGYVGDNMEGAVDQAMFLARLDVPIAIIGPRGTGKMYVAKVVHQEFDGAADNLLVIDCLEFRSRKQASARIADILANCEGKTLVFKSPQALHPDVQIKLARQISTRILADVTPSRYLPRVKLVALFPQPIERLMRTGGLTQQLAGAFAGYPIHVPPIRDRKQAVLRWAHKILGQECAQRERVIKGFTPDAEQAMLQHDWPGNISEMRECIVAALDKTDKQWITPVDLGIFKGLSTEGTPLTEHTKPFLAMVEEVSDAQETYVPSSLEALELALGEAVNSLLKLRVIRPLGTWLDDDLVVAVTDRYRRDIGGAAQFLHTTSRNINRWRPKIQARTDERSSSALWQEPRRLLREWVRSSPQIDESPMEMLQAVLLRHVVKQCDGLGLAEKARVMGVSAPTYLKRLRNLQDDDGSA
tara:strand:- start:103135 stop:105735 length:2601 start_codon:yes stop_codon:yes gene_type:complete